jgi:hypothetical protein
MKSINVIQIHFHPTNASLLQVRNLGFKKFRGGFYQDQNGCAQGVDFGVSANP